MKTAPKKKPALAPFRVTDAELAALDAGVTLLQKLKIESITEARIVRAAARTVGATIGDITEQLDMPFSTASRVAFSLLERGLLRYAPHPTDRRKKIVSANLERLA